MKEIDWDSVPLGKKTDKEIASELHCSRARVRKARRDRGIPLSKLPVDWSKVPLGKVPDKDLATQLDVSLYRVGYVRRQLGIPQYRRKSEYPPNEELLAMLETRTLKECADELGIPFQTLYAHIKRHIGSVKDLRRLPKVTQPKKLPWPSREWLLWEIKLKGVEWVARSLNRPVGEVETRAGIAR